MGIHGDFDHELKIGSTTERFRLIRGDEGVMYNIRNIIPQYRDPLTYTQADWIDGHGNFVRRSPSAYFEGQSIDTTQEGKVFLGPLLQHQGDDQGSNASIGAAPTHYCWFPAIGKLLCATATSTWFLDAGGWNSSTTTVANITQMVVLNSLIVYFKTSPSASGLRRNYVRQTNIFLICLIMRMLQSS